MFALDLLKISHGMLTLEVDYNDTPARLHSAVSSTSHGKSKDCNIATDNCNIATDKRRYPQNIFLISLQNHMLWVLIRSASLQEEQLSVTGKSVCISSG